MQTCKMERNTKIILPKLQDPKHLHYFLAEKKRLEHIHKNNV